MKLVYLIIHLTTLDTTAIADDYLAYHRRISEAEELITKREFSKALEIYDEVFDEYEFVFLRDCKVAAQLAIYEGNNKDTLKYLRLGISHGWQMKSMKQNELVNNLKKQIEWKIIKKQYDSLRALYEKRINHELRVVVKKMFMKDQLKALGALFTFSSARLDKYV